MMKQNLFEIIVIPDINFDLKIVKKYQSVTV